MNTARARPEAWPAVNLGEVADMCLGKMLDAHKNRGRPQPYLRNPNVRWFDVDLADVQLMPFEEHEDVRYGLSPGDVVICEGGEAGRSAIWDGRIANMKFQKAIHRVRCGPRLNNRYLVHRLMADYFSGRLADYYTGATIKHLTGQDLARYRFPLPPLREQRRIAEILDKADALRAKRRAALAQLDTLTQSIFLDMFGDPATNPRRWPEESLLGDVAEVVSGITIGRKLVGKQARVVPYLAVINVQDRRLNLQTVKTTYASVEEIERYRLKRSDLLLTEGGDPDKLGRGTLWDGSVAECIHQNHVFRVRLHDQSLTPLFLSWIVGSERGKRYFRRSAKQTTGIASINMTQLRAFPLLTPPLALQIEFGERINQIEQVGVKLAAAAADCDALFASLQHHAFRGEL